MLVSVALCGSCGTYFNQPTTVMPPRTGETTPFTKSLRSLPEPKEPVVVGVYNFKDQTGQYKNVENGSTFSTAVPQGATTMLIKALEDSKWFTPIERENLSNLLNERNIIRSTRTEYEGAQKGQPNLPPLLFAGILLEGGIISYDSNIITGGYGARYFGVGGSTQYRQDRITIYLRAVSTSNGKILKTVYVSKTILSQALDASLFRYVNFQRLLEVETGITKNEPIQLAIQSAIENAVEALIIEGIEGGLWESKEGGRLDETLVEMYRANKAEEESRLLFNRNQNYEYHPKSVTAFLSSPLFNGDFSDKSMGAGFRLGYQKFVSPYWSAGIVGDYHYFTSGNGFYKEYMAGNVQLKYHMLPYERISPTVYVGAGWLADIRSEEPGLSESTSGINLQYGLGLKYRVGKKTFLTVFAENNITTSDAVDNVVNGKRDDFYYNFGLGLEIKLGKSITKYRPKNAF